MKAFFRVLLVFVVLCLGVVGMSQAEKLYYDTGEIVWVGEINSDGQSEGLWKRYYKSGELQIEVNYINDKREGIAKQYYKSGKLMHETNYKNDKAEGIQKRFYESGELNHERIMKNDHIEGLQKVYYKTGELKIEINWRNGKEDGSEKNYSKSGNLLAENTYQNGILISAYNIVDGVKKPVSQGKVDAYNKNHGRK